MSNWCGKAHEVICWKSWIVWKMCCEFYPRNINRSWRKLCKKLVIFAMVQIDKRVKMIEWCIVNVLSLASMEWLNSSVWILPRKSWMDQRARCKFCCWVLKNGSLLPVWSKKVHGHCEVLSLKMLEMVKRIANVTSELFEQLLLSWLVMHWEWGDWAPVEKNTWKKRSVWEICEWMLCALSLDWAKVSAVGRKGKGPSPSKSDRAVLCKFFSKIMQNVPKNDKIMRYGIFLQWIRKGKNRLQLGKFC